jgi:hypothetical protein
MSVKKEAKLSFALCERKNKKNAKEIKKKILIWMHELDSSTRVGSLRRKIFFSHLLRTYEYMGRFVNISGG